jgi:phage N-6-adenine-methyltransferase
MTKPENDGNWDTPDNFFRACSEIWGPFDLDVAADATNARAPRFFTKEDNGLSAIWTGNVWANPPYLRKTLHLWVKKALAYQGSVVMLLPARVDVRWFHDAVARDQATFLLLKGRLSFAGMGPARWPSMLLVNGHSGFKPGILTFDWKKVLL